MTETTNSGQTLTFTFGDLTGDAPKITQLITRQGGGTCQRVLSAVSNVVLDVEACGQKITDEGSRIADAMAANVSK